jgi:hypothetical protein
MVSRRTFPQDPLPQPRTRAHQSARSDPRAHFRVRTAWAHADREARRPLDHRDAWSAAGDCNTHGDAEGLQEASRDPKALYATAFGGGCVLAEGEAADSPRAKAQAGPAAAIVFHNKAEEQELGSIGFPTPPQFKTKFDAYGEIYREYQPPDARYLSNHRGHLMFLRPEERDIINADVIRAFTFTGTRAELADGLRAMKAAGYSQFGMHIRTGHEIAMLEDWTEVIARV